MALLAVDVCSQLQDTGSDFTFNGAISPGRLSNEYNLDNMNAQQDHQAAPFSGLNFEEDGGEVDSPYEMNPISESTWSEEVFTRSPIQTKQGLGHESSSSFAIPSAAPETRLIKYENTRQQALSGSSSISTDLNPSWPTTPAPTFGYSRPTSRDDFQIAFICALPIEKTAVQAMFDNDWDDWEGAPKYGTAQHDDNVYAHGRIGEYNVVVANIGGKGKRLAAAAAKDVRYTWPGLQLILVVGICGAVPFPSPEIGEIILGDVVIGSGVVQYDHGRHTNGGFIPYKKPEDLLPAPRSRVQHRVDKFRGVIDNRRLCDKLERNLEHIQRVPDIKAAYPGAEHDKLYRGDIIDATAGVACDEAGCNCFVPRHRLENFQGMRPRPAVHIGPIGSADALMKSGSERDRIAEQDGVIAFEMEGAGAVGDMPCLVIKGVSDYADSHKNKWWQPHAAAAAAACAAAFLDDW
jgi:nucleoside phosphorylase